MINQNTTNFRALEKPERLDRILIRKEIDGKHFVPRKVFLKNIVKNEELASTPIIDLIGIGSTSIAFETENGDVLKLSEGNHFPIGRPQEDFDVPIYKKGKVGNVYYYFEEKLMQHDMPSYFVSIIKDRIKEKGYKCYDLGDNDLFQIGLSKTGKLYLIDPECARCKTLFHGLWNKVKSIISQSKIKSKNIMKF